METSVCQRFEVTLRFCTVRSLRLRSLVADALQVCPLIAGKWTHKVKKETQLRTQFHLKWNGQVSPVISERRNFYAEKQLSCKYTASKMNFSVQLPTISERHKFYAEKNDFFANTASKMRFSLFFTPICAFFQSLKDKVDKSARMLQFLLIHSVNIIFGIIVSLRDASRKTNCACAKSRNGNIAQGRNTGV